MDFIDLCVAALVFVIVISAWGAHATCRNIKRKIKNVIREVRDE